MPSRRTSWRGSPASSRFLSSFQIGLTMSATGRSGFGNAVAGAPDCETSRAAPETVNAAAKAAVIVARIVTARTRVLNGAGADGAEARGEALADIGVLIEGSSDSRRTPLGAKRC